MGIRNAGDLHVVSLHGQGVTTRHLWHRVGCGEQESGCRVLGWRRSVGLCAHPGGLGGI
jgi:hypothetical protein